MICSHASIAKLHPIQFTKYAVFQIKNSTYWKEMCKAGLQHLRWENLYSQDWIICFFLFLKYLFLFTLSPWFPVAATFQLYFYKFIRGYISLHVYFETLLMLLSEIDNSNLTLFLVDEISTPSRKKFISKIVFGKNATIFW